MYGCESAGLHDNSATAHTEELARTRKRPRATTSSIAAASGASTRSVLKLEAKQLRALGEIEQRALSKGLLAAQLLHVVSIIEQLQGHRLVRSDEEERELDGNRASSTSPSRRSLRTRHDRRESNDGVDADDDDDNDDDDDDDDDEDHEEEDDGGSGDGVASRRSLAPSTSTSSNSSSSSSNMAEALIARLIKCLIPAEPSLDEEVVVQLVACVTPMSWRNKLHVVQWLSLVYDLIDHQHHYVLALYPMLFQLLQYHTLRTSLCPLLVRLTRRQHVVPFRARALLKYYQQQPLSNASTAASNAAAHALLELIFLFQEYQADIIVLPPTNHHHHQLLLRRKATFAVPDPEWYRAIMRVQEVNALEQSLRSHAVAAVGGARSRSSQPLLAVGTAASTSTTTSSSNWPAPSSSAASATSSTTARSTLPLALPSQRLVIDHEDSKGQAFVRAVPSTRSVIPTPSSLRAQLVRRVPLTLRVQERLTLVAR